MNWWINEWMGGVLFTHSSTNPITQYLRSVRAIIHPQPIYLFVAMQPSDSPPKKTPLFSEHEKRGAKVIPFGGWAMPVQYSSIIDEHNAVRQAVGVFDIS